jgi:hypothetical protein
MAMTKVSKSSAALPPSVRKNSLIPFVFRLKKMDKVDGPDTHKSEWINLEFLMDPDNLAWGSKYSRQFDFFMDGCRVPEEWIKWLMAFRVIENLMTIKEPADETKMFRTLLKGQGLSYFGHHLMRRLDAEDSDACIEAKTGSRKKSLAFPCFFSEINALKKQLNSEQTAGNKKRNKEGWINSLYWN